MKSSNGWVKLHRQFLEWEWFDEPNTFRLFIYCLLRANHQDKSYRGDTIKRGTFVTSLDDLSKDTKISVRSVRTSLKRLESTGELTSVRTPKGTVIQVVNYNDYQEVTNETTNERQASDKQVTTNKNVKKEKKYREFLHLSISESEFIQLLNRGYTKQQVDIILDKIERYDKVSKYKDLYKTCINWLGKEFTRKQQNEEVDPLVKKMMDYDRR